MTEPIRNWGDSDPPTTDDRFSPRRTAKLFLVVIWSMILGTLPFALYEFGILSYQDAQEEKARQEQLDKGMREMEKAAREGRTGEAGRRLFGIDEPQTPPASPDKNAKSGE